jgi:RsiW-degrading membrane proteinase PrsW (M82 family)
MDTISYIALCIPPVIAIIFYAYLVLRNNKRFGLLLLKSYIAGAIAPLVLIFSIYIAKLSGLDTFTNLFDTLLYAFIFLGFGSELGKFLVYRFYILSKPEVDTPIHSIAFSVMVALGFTTMTVLLFVFDLFDASPPYPKNMYLLLAAPSNIIFAVVMGFFVGMSKFIESKVSYALFGLLAAGFFNGLFKFCLITHDYKLLNIFAFGSALIVMVLIIKAVNQRS